jgi:adenylate kinase
LLVVFLGAPGAGKGTQAMRVAAKLQLAHVATGDLFRQAIQQGTAQGLKAKAFMDSGKLVPDAITVQMVLERIEAPDCAAGVILDGFPRNVAQAEALDKALAAQTRSVDSVLYLKVSEKVLLERLGGRWICRKCQTPYHVLYSPPRVAGTCDKCGGELYQRSDDTAETVKKRLAVFEAETAPLIQFYSKKDTLVEVDGEGLEDAVEGRIVATLRRVTGGARGR